ncbi:STING domain-containing protein [Reichenbachiella sp.]|uniref:STING domain-containing protein n=1 Tax=Reichenbachiella sp. TaxID=2184521 RepID=UPI003B59FE10
MNSNRNHIAGRAITLILLLLWFFYPELTQWEPIIGVWVVLQGAVIYFQKRRIEKLEFSPAISLAHGYVNNFLEPAISELLQKNGSSNLDFKVYIPSELEELSDQQIERMKLQIQSKGYQLNQIKLKRKTGRPHDILTVEKQEGSVSYFDFPRTLLSLQSYIDYKVASSRNESTDFKKQVLGNKLIEAFNKEVRRLIEKKNLTDAVSFTEKSLSF